MPDPAKRVRVVNVLTGEPALAGTETVRGDTLIGIMKSMIVRKPYEHSHICNVFHGDGTEAYDLEYAGDFGNEVRILLADGVPPPWPKEVKNRSQMQMNWGVPWPALYRVSTPRTPTQAIDASSQGADSDSLTFSAVEALMGNDSEEPQDDEEASPATADGEAESSPPPACLKCGRMVEGHGLCDACHLARVRGPSSRVSLRSVRAQLANRCGTCGSLVGSGQGESACAVCETGLKVASPQAQEALAELEGAIGGASFQCTSDIHSWSQLVSQEERRRVKVVDQLTGADALE